MDIAPVYELKSRLRAAAVAGTGLIKEDFRLARAIEGFKPLVGASPVFKKIAELSDTLLKDECPDTAGTLLDLLSLTNSVICTLGVTAVKGEISDIEAPAEGSVVINAPYSVLHELLTALTSSGSGHYSFLTDQHELNRPLFSDYRVRPALVKALGASYSETANAAGNWLCEQGKAVIPLLKKDFDPKGKKEMARRVKVIDMISGAEENAFYLEQLDNSAKDIRYRLIYALRHSKENVAKLIELCGDKGAKKYAMAALAQIDCDESIEYFRKLAEKKPFDAFEGLRYGYSDRVCDLTADILNDVLTKDGKPITIKEYLFTDKTAFNFELLFFGKHGKKIQDILRRNEDSLSLAWRLRVTLIYTADEDTMRFTEQWYSETKSDKLKVALIPALIISKLMSGEDCTEWLRELFAAKGLIDGREAAAVIKEAATLVLDYIVPCADSCEYFDLMITRHDVFEESFECTRRVNQPLDKIIEIFADNPDKDMIRALGGFAMSKCRKNCDEKLRQKLGDFFARLIRVEPTTQLIAYMSACGRKDFRGLAAIFCKRQTDTVRNNNVAVFIANMCLSDEESAAEVMDVVGKLRSGELKCKNLNPDELENWAHVRWNMP